METYTGTFPAGLPDSIREIHGDDLIGWSFMKEWYHPFVGRKLERWRPIGYTVFTNTAEYTYNMAGQLSRIGVVYA